MAVSTVALAHGHTDAKSVDESHCAMCMAVHSATHVVAYSEYHVGFLRQLRTLSSLAPKSFVGCLRLACAESRPRPSLALIGPRSPLNRQANKLVSSAESFGLNRHLVMEPVAIRKDFSWEPFRLHHRHLVVRHRSCYAWNSRSAASPLGLHAESVSRCAARPSLGCATRSGRGRRRRLYAFESCASRHCRYAGACDRHPHRHRCSTDHSGETLKER